MASFCLKFPYLLKAIPKIKYTPTASFCVNVSDHIIKAEIAELQKIHTTKDDESIVVSQIPCMVTKSDLHSCFSTFGKILYIKYPFQPNGFPSKVAEIKFEDCNAPRALEQTQVELKNQKDGSHCNCKSHMVDQVVQWTKEGEFSVMCQIIQVLPVFCNANINSITPVKVFLPKYMPQQFKKDSIKQFQYSKEYRKQQSDFMDSASVDSLF